MRHLTRITALLGLLVLSAGPAWAHPGSGPHMHGDQLALLLAVAAALVALGGRMRREEKE